MDAIGIIILVVGALVVGFLYRYVGENRGGSAWLITAVGAALGGFVGSEWLGSVSTVGPESGGLFAVPALIGAVLLGGVVEFAVRRSSNPEPVRRTAH
jgi:uncharacterized membrane protein YeaQ/YmgE (transglycosylase-associated protein family)